MPPRPYFARLELYSSLTGLESLISELFCCCSAARVRASAITVSCGEQLPKEGLTISSRCSLFSSLHLCAQQMIISQKHSVFFSSAVQIILS